MIRYVQALVPAILGIDAKSEWEDVRDRFRRFVDETRRAFDALPRMQERDIRYDPDDGDVTIEFDMRPRIVLVAYASVSGTQTATTSVTWRPGSSGRSVVLSGVGGLSSGTRYDVRLFVMGEG